MYVLQIKLPAIHDFSLDIYNYVSLNSPLQTESLTHERLCL